MLVPGGVVVVTNAELLQRSDLSAGGFALFSDVDSTLVARKPWPRAMDVWSHSRHAADGNAVSQDTLVGPPDRVRWVAAATSEVEGMVTAGGRNFHGRILARDSFNGLRLWHRDSRTQGENNPDDFMLPKLDSKGARPVASDKLLFAVLKDRPVALHAATGEVAVELGDLIKPTTLIHAGNRVIAADAESVRAFAPSSGTELWNVPAADSRNVISDGNVTTFIQGRLRRGDKAEVVAVDAKTGKVKWQRTDFTWLLRTTRTVLAKVQLVFEVSTFNDDDEGNGIHVVSAETGEHRWSKHYAPGMNHRRQARAMFLEDDLWILHGGKVNTANKTKTKTKRERGPVQISALDPFTDKTRVAVVFARFTFRFTVHPGVCPRIQTDLIFAIKMVYRGWNRERILLWASIGITDEQEISELVS